MVTTLALLQPTDSDPLDKGFDLSRSAIADLVHARRQSARGSRPEGKKGEIFPEKIHNRPELWYRAGVGPQAMSVTMPHSARLPTGSLPASNSDSSVWLDTPQPGTAKRSAAKILGVRGCRPRPTHRSMARPHHAVPRIIDGQSSNPAEGCCDYIDYASGSEISSCRRTNLWGANPGQEEFRA
jgi:hypothetical protein